MSQLPKGPVAWLYARLSAQESELTCDGCQRRWSHSRGLVATCPQCGKKQDVTTPNSIERQLERMQHWCKAKWSDDERPHLILVKELGSGANEFKKRKEGEGLYEAMRPGDFLIVCKLDRGWRSARDFHNTIHALDQRQITLIVIEEQYDTSTAMGRFMVSLSVALAQLERDRTSERMKAMIAHCKAKGLCSGNHVPFGKKVTICQKTGQKIVVDDDDERRLAKWVYTMRFENHYEWRALVTAAEELGFRNRAGRPFNINKLMDIGTIARKWHAEGILQKIRGV